MPNFQKSKTVTALTSGKVRNDEFDDAVRMAWAERGTVLEELVASDDIAQEYRKGLARSAKYLADVEGIPVRVSLDFENHTNSKGEETGKVWVRFAAQEKRKTPRVNGTDADESETGTEGAETPSETPSENAA